MSGGSARPIPVFDGHNDTLLRLWQDGTGDALRLFRDGGAPGHIDVAKARAGGLVGGLFAIFPPSPRDGSLSERMREAPYDLPLPAELPHTEGLAATLAMAAILLRLSDGPDAPLRLCRTVGEIRDAVVSDRLAAVMHIEGAEAIGDELDELEILHAAGLRSIGPLWSRPNQFGHGVPMRYPSGADTGLGLTDAGRRLVRRCAEMRIVVDLSHLNESGFDDVARLTDGPLVATHSNAHAVCPVSRNLSDRQLAVIRERGGLVGLNFATAFLRPDGRMDPDTGLDILQRHLDHLLEALGESGVALGSDFDGATVPAAIGDAAGLPRLLDHLAEGGYGPALVRKIASDNWLALLERIWGE